MSEDAASEPRPDSDEANPVEQPPSEPGTEAEAEESGVASDQEPGPASTEEPARSDAGDAGDPGQEAAPTPAPAAVQAQAPAPPASQGVDAVGILAHVLFILIGGLLVFGFAYALWPAVDVQNDAPCRSLRPNALAYTPAGLKLGDGVEGEGLPEIEIRPAPEMQLERLDGSPVSLTDYAGKFVVLNFWASWCEPCLREWPQLDKLGRRLGETEDVVILAVSLDHEFEDIQPYLDQAGLSETPVEVVFDRSGEANKLYGSEALPDTFFIDKKGQLIGAFVNVREWGKPHAFRCVEATAKRR